MNRDPAPPLITPAWPLPAPVKACFTTRRGGHSEAPWATFNLATHVGDNAASVRDNRAALSRACGLARPPQWLTQVHGRDVCRVGDAMNAPDTAPRADAAITRAPGTACAVLVADCVPVLLCADDGSEVAAVHAGWRGLAAGVIAATVAAFSVPAPRLHAWIGPCIRADAYTVGAELVARFAANPALQRTAFRRRHGQWTMDLAACAAFELKALGLTSVTDCGLCVHADAERFYSYRRDGETGRMAALIWIT